MVKWTEAEDAVIEQLRGMSQGDPRYAAVCQQLGRSVASTRNRLKRTGKVAQARPQATVNNAEFLAMQVASLEQKLAQQETHHNRVPVTSYVAPDDTDETLWAAAERRTATLINAAYERHRFEATLPSKVCGIAFVSDQHIAPESPCDLARMREDAKLIASTPNLFAVLGGDGVDNHIKHRSAILNSRSTPGDQWRLFNFYLGIFAHKVIALVSGNHDDWTVAVAGVDMLKEIAAKNRIAYAPDEARINVTCGTQQYKVAIRHQYRLNSSFNQTHSPKQWFRNGTEEFDVGVICHHHEPASEHCILHGKKRWVARPGSYQYTSAYSRQLGYNPALPTCPTVILFPDERRLVGFDDVRDAALLLKGLA